MKLARYAALLSALRLVTIMSVIEPGEAAVHGAARQDDTALAFAAVAVQRKM